MQGLNEFLELDLFRHEAAALTRAALPRFDGKHIPEGLYVETLARDGVPEKKGPGWFGIPQWRDDPSYVPNRMTSVELFDRMGGVVFFPGLTAPPDYPLKKNIVEACVDSAPQMPLVVGWYTGHGKSKGNLAEIDVATLVRDTYLILDNPDYVKGPSDIHAHSAGALAALYAATAIAQTQPERIERVVCYGIPTDYQNGYFQNLLKKPGNRESWEKYGCVSSPAVAEGFYQDQAFVDALTLLATKIVEAKPKFEIVLIGSERDPVGRLDHMKAFAEEINKNGGNARVVECNSSDHSMSNAEVREVTRDLIGNLAQDPRYQERVREAVEDQCEQMLYTPVLFLPDRHRLTLPPRPTIPELPGHAQTKPAIWETYRAENEARLAIVTGGTRGIGAATSRALHDTGYPVAAVYRSNDEAAQKFSAETDIPVFKFDVSDREACKKGIADIEAHFGRPVDILVNNAGITRDGFFHKMPPENWNAVLDTNLGSVFNMTSLVINGMRGRDYPGRIINMSSINANGQTGQTNYSASKAAIEALSKSLAQESALKGITVNAIEPGYTETDMIMTVPPEMLEKIKDGIPTKRLGKPEEVAKMVLFLVSKEAAAVTGEVIVVNGGLNQVQRPVVSHFSPERVAACIRAAQPGSLHA